MSPYRHAKKEICWKTIFQKGATGGVNNGYQISLVYSQKY
jgi:hypothetical protein